MMKIVLLLALLLVGGVSGDGSRIVGHAGGGVTLSCKYDITRYKALAVCWGRGGLPSSGCGNQLVSTDGFSVVDGTRASSRYRLLGRLEDGDVSLTILNVSQMDAGRYGCRVDIPGWFNDDKHHFVLVVLPPPQMTTSSTLTRETSTQQADISPPAGQLTSTELLLTSSSSSVTAQDSSGVEMILVCVLFGLVALVTAGAVIVIASRRRRLSKTREQRANSAVLFTAPLAPSALLQLQNRAVENIYQIDDGGDGGEYEYCP